jgi:hypothetical protein
VQQIPALFLYPAKTRASFFTEHTAATIIFIFFSPLQHIAALSGPHHNMLCNASIYTQQEFRCLQLKAKKRLTFPRTPCTMKSEKGDFFLITLKS